jgi:hypothetical protein
MRFGRTTSVALTFIGALLLTGAVSAAAATDPYAADPNGLVPFRDSVTTVYSLGRDVWEVWVCEVPGWDLTLDVATVTDDLNDRITPYYQWLSEGRYTPVFRAGGVVQSDDVLPKDPSAPEYWTPPWAPDCESKVAAASRSGPDGALIVTAGGYGAGYSNPGAFCADTSGGCATYFPDEAVYPGSGRRVVVGAGTVQRTAPFQSPVWNAVAHELGHAIWWPHSFGGLITSPVGGPFEYDNPVDNMSGYEVVGDPIGTTAYNRYSAGWIDPTDVGFYEGGTHTFRLAPVGGDGYGMVVIPRGADGYFYELDYRAADSWDGSLLKSGVETYLVDSRRTACPEDEGWLPRGYPCLGTETRVEQIPAEASTTGTSHVHEVGDTFTVGPYSLSVLQDGVGEVYLRLTDGNYVGRFVDDDGDFHETNIEAIAAAGLTNGCDPPANDRYCPTELVSRASMAAFLIRAVGEDVGAMPYHGYFNDVPADQWYTPYVERMYELGITTGYADGTYRPDRSVSRAEMAAFLVRAFDHASELEQARGMFTDVDPSAWYAPSAELIYDLGITTGCSTSPLKYCPDTMVPRDQMASFLARTLGIGN